MKKIIYFDEGSITDILLIEHGGVIEEIDKNEGTVTFRSNMNAEIEAGASTGFLNFLKVAFKVKGSTDLDASKGSIVTRTVTNTILSDFLSIKPHLISKNKISILENYKVYAIKDSFSFIKMYAPYLRIIKEDSTILGELNDYNLREIDEILTSAKGYYELIGKQNNDKIVLRFNIQQFVNSYTLTDVTKMNLTFYAIEVGTCKEEDLLMQTELSGEVTGGEGTEIDLDELMGSGESIEQSTDKLKVYDVILAGIGDGNDNES